MKKYLTFKHSDDVWLGDIPESWEVKRLKYISFTRVSNVDKKSEDEIPVRLCNYIDVYKNEFINEKIEFMVATATRRQVDSFELKNGDVIITKDSETPDDIGIPAYVELEDTKYIVCGYHLAISTPTNSILLGKYLFRLFQSNFFRSYFEVSSNGITRYGLDTYSIFNAHIPLPSFSEQRIIANFLDRETGKINHLILKKQKLIDLLKEERVAVINQAVTKGIDPSVEMQDSGVDWLGRIPKHWNVMKLKWVSELKYGNSLSDDKRIPGDIPVYGSNGIVGYHNKSLTHKPAIIIGRKGSFGKLNFSNEECFPIDTTFYIDGTATKNNLKWLYYALSILKLDSISKDSAVPGLNREDAYKKALSVPPLSEQNKIADYLERENKRTDLAISKIQTEIDLLQEYRAALISEVVTGKIDVRQEVVS